MLRSCKLLLAASLVVGLGWICTADGPVDKNLKAEEAIDTIDVKIDIGAGEDLTEAVALDLGLGFPLWLHPLGRKADEAAPFGAVPQQTNATAKVAAGTSATFTFTAKGDDGQDGFKTTTQLLAGLQVSDIARVGFISPCGSDWVLGGYEIKINGKVLAAGNPKPDAKAKGTLDAAQKKLADLTAKIDPLEKDRALLADLVQSDLATDADKKQLSDLQDKLAPLAAPKRWLEGQIQGNYPWFVDKEFRPPWRDQALVKQAKVTLVTAIHSGADTQNYVYLHTGGRKYLLGSPTTPLTGNTGPQVFTLDLKAGPLTQADMRTWAVGMLAQPNPLGKVPDRWHPQRIRVEIDGKVAFDSEANEFDRRSLDAIRLIPPVQKDQDGKLVVNTPISRETFVWESGKKIGLDPDSGAVLPLPDTTDANAPRAEAAPPSADPPPNAPAADPADPKADPNMPDPAAAAAMDPNMAPPFPGENPAPADPNAAASTDPNAANTDPNAASSGGANGGGSFGSGGASGGDSGGSSGGGASGGGGGGDPGGGGTGAQPNPSTPANPTNVPTPTGSVFQVNNVRISGAIWKADQTFKVTWQISGDETTIDHYTVSLQPVQPQLDDPFSAPGILLANVPTGSRSATGTLGALPPGVDPRSLFLRPVVTAVPLTPPAPAAPPADPCNPPPATPTPPPTPSAGTGPARAIFPAGSSDVGQPALQTPFSWWRLVGVPKGIQSQTVTWSGTLKGLQRAVWPVNQVVQSDNGVQFDSAFPGQHLGVRLQNGDTVMIELRIPKTAFAGGQRSLVAHLGFLGGSGAINTVKANMICDWRTSTNAAVPGAPPTVYMPPGAAAPTTYLQASAGDSMQLFNQSFDASTLPAAADHLRVLVYFTGGPFDINHPPGLFGLRLVP